MSKQYGLIVPGKEKPAQPTANFSKPSVFADDSDSDDGNGPVLTKLRATQIGPGATERRQARMLQQKALAEDPTIFQYDELYDDIESKRDALKKAKTAEVKAPKYISRLLQQAERRKLENERRIERTVQKEREAEGEEFKDKESYVTSGYRKKLEEIKEAEEKEKREEYLETIGDVRKQQDLGGFYRHIYEQTLGPKETDSTIANEKSEKVESTEENTQIDIKKIPQKPRTYRKRHASDNEDEEDANKPAVKDEISTKKAHIQSNLDADSDFSIDSSSSEDEDDNATTTEKTTDEVIVNIEQPNVPALKVDNPVPIIETEDAKPENDKVEKCEKIEVPEPKKPKIDIWKKRTVGDVFDSALQRYFERKASRNG